MLFYRRYITTISSTQLLDVPTPAAILLPEKIHPDVNNAARPLQVRGELQQRKVDAPEKVDNIKLPRKEVSTSERVNSLHLVAQSSVCQSHTLYGSV